MKKSYRAGGHHPHWYARNPGSVLDESCSFDEYMTNTLWRRNTDTSLGMKLRVMDANNSRQTMRPLTSRERCSILSGEVFAAFIVLNITEKDGIRHFISGRHTLSETIQKAEEIKDRPWFITWNGHVLLTSPAIAADTAEG